MKSFQGYHSEWNLGSPGGWDYQRITQIIGKAVWSGLSGISPIGVDLDFDHPFCFRSTVLSRCCWKPIRPVKAKTRA